MKTVEQLMNDLQNNLPKIDGKSEKQIKYAQDLRNVFVFRFVDGVRCRTSDKEIAEDYLAFINLTAEEREACAKESGMTVEEYNSEVNDYINTLALHVVLNETNASKIIDKLR